MTSVNMAKLNALMNTQRAQSNVPPVSSMDDATAAAWCNGTTLCRCDFPASNFAERIGDARHVQGKLKAAQDKHYSGTETLTTNAIEAVDIFLSYCEQKINTIVASTSTDYQRLSDRCDALCAPNTPAIISDEDRTAILALSEMHPMLCQLDPATVDLDEYGHRAEHWLSNSQQIGTAHVTQCRALYPTSRTR